MGDATADADGWKTVCIRTEKFLDAVIGRIKDNEFRISPVPFHRYIRHTRLSKWLDMSGATRTKGVDRVGKLAKILCQSLPCEWTPSERMSQQTRKRKPAETSTTSGSEGYEMMVTPAWLLVYILLPNSSSHRNHMDKTKDTRRRAFHVLTLITKLACEAGQRKIRTKHTTFFVSEDGHMEFDGSWQAASGTATGLGAVRRFLDQYDTEENGRIAPGMVNSSTLAGMLWHIARLCWKTTHMHNSGLRDVAKDISYNLIRDLTQGLREWFEGAKEATSIEVLASQAGKTRTPPILVANLMKKTRPRHSAKDWHEDGGKTTASAAHLERRTSAGYLSSIHDRLGQEGKVEMCIDGTMFAGRELDVIVVYAPKVNVAAYLPPVTVRRLHWRAAHAGSKISDADRQKFLKSGFRKLERVTVYDALCGWEHCLKAGLGKSLADFRLPEPLPLMEPGSMRYQHNGSWYRTSSSRQVGASGPDPGGSLEMPSMGYPLEDVPVFMLSVDQKQNQWSACH